MWVRGLKPNIREEEAHRLVAPYVGAWIETTSKGARCPRTDVAPYVGAWIETSVIDNILLRSLSHPMWVRGLKLIGIFKLNIRQSRTLCGCVD